MSTLFRLDASIRREGSVTRAVADTVQASMAEHLNPTRVVRRDVAHDPIPGALWAASAFAGYTPEGDRTSEQRAAVAQASELADEVATADVLIFAVPMYNFGVSQHFKTWYDLVSTDPRFAPGMTQVAGRPAFLVTARGGGYGPGTPRAGWDHATGWMRRVLGEVLGLDLELIETELTLAEVTPAMAELRQPAREQLAQSHEAAGRAGRSVGVRLRGEARVAS
jgi:FMN-dependent NADH-azoreductase